MSEKAIVTERRWATYDIAGPSDLRVQLNNDRSRVLVLQDGDSVLELTGPEWEALCDLRYSISPDEPAEAAVAPRTSMSSPETLKTPVSDWRPTSPAPLPVELTPEARLAAADRVVS